MVDRSAAVFIKFNAGLQGNKANLFFYNGTPIIKWLHWLFEMIAPIFDPNGYRDTDFKGLRWFNRIAPVISGAGVAVSSATPLFHFK